MRGGRYGYRGGAYRGDGYRGYGAWARQWWAPPAVGRRCCRGAYRGSWGYDAWTATTFVPGGYGRHERRDAGGARRSKPMMKSSGIFTKKMQVKSLAELVSIAERIGIASGTGQMD